MVGELGLECSPAGLDPRWSVPPSPPLLPPGLAPPVRSVQRLPRAVCTGSRPGKLLSWLVTGLLPGISTVFGME